MDEQKNSGRLRLIIFLAFVLACVSILYWQYDNLKIKSKKQRQEPEKPQTITTSFERNINTMKKIDQMSQVLPTGFPNDIPLYKSATITDKYNLQDERLKEPTEAVVVFKSSASLEEIKQFYLKKLENSEYKYIAEPNALNTEQKKILAFFNPAGILIVIVDKTEEGTVTFVRFSKNI